jgi:hypothetical protein
MQCKIVELKNNAKLAYKCMDIGEKYHTHIRDYVFSIHWIQLMFLLRLLPFSIFVSSVCTLVSFICVFLYHMYQIQFAPSSKHILQTKPKSNEVVFFHQCIWVTLLSQLIWSLNCVVQENNNDDWTTVSWYMLTYLCTIFTLEKPQFVFQLSISLCLLYFIIWMCPIALTMTLPILFFVVMLVHKIIVCFNKLPSVSLALQLWQVFGIGQLKYIHSPDTNVVSSALWLIPIMCILNQSTQKNIKTYVVGALTYNFALFFNSTILHCIGIAFTAWISVNY